jgi:hypothetical protein
MRSANAAVANSSHCLSIKAACGSIQLMRATTPAGAYLTTFQNPTGHSISRTDREMLLAAAETTKTPIVEDRVLADLHSTDKPLRHRSRVAAVSAVGPRLRGRNDRRVRDLAGVVQWCQSIGRDWRETPAEFGRFVLWLRYYDSGRRGGRAPPGGARRSADQRGDRGRARVLQARRGDRPGRQGRAGCALRPGRGLRPAAGGPRRRHDPVPQSARHRLSEPEVVVDAATDEEVLALLHACRNARDRFIVLALWRIGNRRGELTGVRMEDVHFLPDSSALGCQVRGPHLHVPRRDNSNGATAKSRRSRAVPVDWLLVQAFDQYMLIRNATPQARQCDFLLPSGPAYPSGR